MCAHRGKRQARAEPSAGEREGTPSHENGQRSLHPEQPGQHESNREETNKIREFEERLGAICGPSSCQPVRPAFHTDGR